MFKAGRRGKGRGPKAKLAESLSSEGAFPGASSSGFPLCVSELGPQSPPHCRGAWEINLLKKAGHIATLRRVQKETSSSSSKKYSGTKTRRPLLLLPLTPIPASCLPRMGALAALLLIEGASLGQSWLTERAERSLGCLSGSPFQFIPHIACHFTAKPKLNKYFKVLSFPPVTHLLVNVLRRTRQTS